MRSLFPAHPMRHTLNGLHSVTVLALLVIAPGAPAQTSPPAPVCAEATDLTPAHLYGLWQLVFWPEGGSESAPVSSGSLLFERHPDHPGSVRGQMLRRAAAGIDRQAFVAGDVFNGDFQLDESADGVNMDAVWSGLPQDCGRVIRGTRRPAEGRPADEPPFNFVLKKTTDWR